MEKVTKLIPLIYPLLLFTGYLDYVSYYRQFHLSIVSYLTTSELLLSFLNITPPILFLILIISIFFIVELSAISNGRIDKEKTIAEPEPSALIFSFIKSYKRIVEGIKKIKFRFAAILLLLMDILGFCISFLALLFFILYFFIILAFLVESKPMTDMMLSIGFIISLCWFIILLNLVITAIDKIKKPFSTQILLGSAIITFLSLIAIYNKQKSSEILKGMGQYKVSLIINDKPINTDTSFIFIGKTEKYFFFYDRKKQMNTIYPADEVKLIQTSILDDDLK